VKNPSFRFVLLLVLVLLLDFAGDFEDEDDDENEEDCASGYFSHRLFSPQGCWQERGLDIIPKRVCTAHDSAG
jgi:hypothetical protein